MATSNEFKLTCSDLVALSYLEGSFVITEGEKSSPPPNFKHDPKSSTWIITIGADRKGSKPVANSFKSVTGGALHEYTNAGGDKSPDELNFYFGVVGTFAVGGKNVNMTFYLGQGHYFANNNWWLGANSLLNHKSDPLYNVISGGNILQTYKVTGDGNFHMTFKGI